MAQFQLGVRKCVGCAGLLGLVRTLFGNFDLAFPLVTSAVTAEIEQVSLSTSLLWLLARLAPARAPTETKTGQ